MEQVKLNELKGSAIRTTIPCGEKEITVFNVIGERRQEVLEELIKMVAIGKGKVGDDTVEQYYSYLITECTDIEYDDTMVSDLIINPTLPFQVLKKELDEISYELQYEYMCDKLNETRITVISGMGEQINTELTAYLESLLKQKERFQSLNK